MIRGRRIRLPRRRTVSRYDLVLGIIPVVFGIALLLAAVGWLAVEEAIVGGSIIGVLAVIDALFLNPPGFSGPPPSVRDRRGRVR